MRESRRVGRVARGARAGRSTTADRQLIHPFAPQDPFSADEANAIHDAALTLLERLGIRFLLPEARALFAAAGAPIEEEMVFIGRDIVAAALATAPTTIRLATRNPARAQDYALGTLMFTPAGGSPNVSDRVQGRRPGALADYHSAVRLSQSFDAIHTMPASPEPQDVPVHLRHYATTHAQITLGDKPPFLYARGQAQTEDCFAMLRLGLNLSDDEFAGASWAMTVINSNSPRVFDRVMAQGIIDFARAGQMSVITPFCLAGAMAPVSLSAALVLQHAEALAGITLAQLAKPGAPVSYGGFSTNVDLKSGAPAFGTAAHVTMQLGSGQMARLIGLPWRSASGSASNAADAQGAGENAMGLWGAMLSGASMVVHAAGWLEGGLTFGFEKFVTDMELVEALAELCRPAPAYDSEAALAAIAEAGPGGHYLGAGETMAHFAEAFRPALVADLSPQGSWEAAGAPRAEERATALWQRRVAECPLPEGSGEIAERLAGFIERRTAEGGAEVPDS